MGADIHLHVEVKTEQGWRQASRDEIKPWDDRNYSVFAMLADVRNGYGFAGSDLGDPVVPIAAPRGLPQDVCAGVLGEHEEWGPDAHSASHFTGAELVAVPWSANTITHRAWVRRTKGSVVRPQESHDDYAARLQEAATFLGYMPPAENWQYEMCGWSSEGQGDSGWRTIEWAESWARAAGPAFLGFVLDLARLSQGRPENVRAVFWFDN